MVTNFDYLKNESKFSAFANVAISAEKIILADPDASILNSRRAMEFAVKWLYSVENSLQIPYQDNLHTLMNAEEFRQLVGPDLWKRMDYIRRCGNSVAHSNKKPGRDAAMPVSYTHLDVYKRQHLLLGFLILSFHFQFNHSCENDQIKVDNDKIDLYT